MSKRPLHVDCSSPNIVIIPTIVISDNDEPSPPPKKPNLAESSQPPVSQVQVDLDSIPVPPPPLPKEASKNSETVLQSVNVNPIKKVLSVNTNKHPIVSKCEPGVKKSPETQEREVKSCTKQPSWASNYLKSIGLTYNKPIKVNLTSSNKKFNVGLEELNQSKSTEDNYSKDAKEAKMKQFPAELPADKTLVSMTTTSNNEVNKTVLIPKPNLEIRHPEILYAANDIRAEKCVPFATQSAANKQHVSIINPSNSEVINRSIINPEPDFKIRHPDMFYASRDMRQENCIIFPTQSLANETLLSMSYRSNNEVVTPQPYFGSRHPEMLYINESPLCTNFCTNFQNHEMYTTNTFMGYDNLRTNATFHRPGEDKFYLDEVDQFLSKISQDSPHCHGYDRKEIESKTRTRSLSLKKRDVSHNENPQKIKTNTKIDGKIRQHRYDTRISDRESMRMEGIKKRYDTERDDARQLFAERYKERPSTSNKIYYDEKEHSENQKSDMPKHTFKYKRRHSSDSSSSEFIRKSYQDESSRRLSKRRRSNSSTSSENNRERLSRHNSKIIENEKRTAKRDLDSSDSSDCSMPCCSRKINHHTQQSERSKNSSNSEIRRHCSLQHEQISRKSKLHIENDQNGSTQKIKQHKSRRGRSRSSSGSETRSHGSPQLAQKSKLPIENDRDVTLLKTQKIKQHKSRRDRSKSSSGSETRRHGSPQHEHKNKLHKESGRDESHKSQKIKQDKSRRDRSNSNKSETCQTTKTKKSKKSKRERSNSSSHSKISPHNMPCHVHTLQENKKVKRSSSGNNSDRSRSPHAYRNREKLEKQIKTKSSNSSHKSTDSYKTKKVTNDVICKDENKKTLIKSSSTCKKPKESSKKDNCAELTSTTTDTNGPKLTSEFASTMHRFKEASDVQVKTKDSAAIKSVVQIKDRHKSRYNTSDAENFDLRSKLSRRGLSQYFDKLCYCKTNNKTDERENLRITFPNEAEENITVAHEDDTKQKILNTARDKLIKNITVTQEDDTKQKILNTARDKLIKNITVTHKDDTKQKILNTARDKLIKLGQKKSNDNNAKNKKRKKFKLVINVICNSSQSSDSDDVEEISDKKRKDESTVMKNVITENNICNELSFLDDINIDEIVQSLTCNQNESCSSKNATDAAITVSSSSPEIDTYLVSDSEHSDASTVHLEELLETHDNLKAVENNNTNPQCQRISIVENKLHTEETNINMTIKSEKEESDQKVTIGENEIKKEIYEDNNDILLSNDKQIDPRHDNIEESMTIKDETNKATFIDNTSFIGTGKQEPACKVVNEGFKILDAKFQEVERFPNSKNKTNELKQINITNTHGTPIPLHKVKDEHTDKENDEAKKHEHKKDCNFIPTSEIEECKDFLPNNGLVTERKKEVNNCTLFLESPESGPALPLIPLNKIKEETPSEVPKEISVETMQDVLKNNSKESSKLGESKKKPETEIIPSIEIKIEAEVGQSVINNLSTSVGESASAPNIIKQSKVGSNDKNDTNQMKISSKCTIKQTNKTIVEKSLITSKSVKFAQNVQDIKEEPSFDTESATSLISGFSKTNAPVSKSSDKVNFEKVTDEESLNSEIEAKENMSDKHLKTATQNAQRIEDANDSNTAEPTSLDKINSKVIKHGEARKDEQMPLNNIAINSNKEVSDNTNMKTKTNNSSNHIEIRTCTIELQNTKQVKKANNTNPQFPAFSEKYQKDEDSQNFAQTQSSNNVMKGNEKAYDNTDLKVKATNSSSEIEKTTDITERQNTEQIKNTNEDSQNFAQTQSNKNVMKGNEKASDNTDLKVNATNSSSEVEKTTDFTERQNVGQIKKTNGSITRDPASSEKENSKKNEVDKSQYVERMQLNNNEMKCDKEVAVKTDLKTKATNSSIQIQINNKLKTMKPIEQANISLLSMKRSDNDNVTTISKSIATGTELKMNEHTESKTVVSKNIQSDNLQKQNVAGLNNNQNLRIESERNKVSDNKNDNLQNKKVATDSGKNIIFKQQLKPTPNVIKNNNLPNKHSATKSLSHSSNIRAMPTQSTTIKTENPNRSVELVLNPSETTLMEKLEDRLSNYLREQYKVDSILHRGRFSKIFRCSDSKGQNYVAKVSSRFGHDRNTYGIATEKMLASLRKDIPEENLNFIRLINGLEVSGQWCLIMEYYPKDLIQVLKENNKSLHISTVQLLSKQLVTAVMVLKHHNIVHSDIKPHHILLNNTNDRLKLCGFDCAYYNKKPGLMPLPSAGTVNYRAPETLLGYSSGYSIDVWSTALVMYEMATRRQLFPGQYNNDILFKQMCTRSFIPNEMIRNSHFAYKHFQGNVFMRRVGHLGQNIVHIREHNICRNTILETTIKSTYYKDWGKNIPKKQKDEELVMLENFLHLLEEMLVVHPHYRLPIERAYAHPFLFDYTD